MTRLVAPGPGSGRAHAHLAGYASVPVGGHCRALLVADQDVTQLGILGKGTIERKNGPARQPENDVHALFQKAFTNYLSAGQLHFISFAAVLFDGGENWATKNPSHEGTGMSSRGTTLLFLVLGPYPKAFHRLGTDPVRRSLGWHGVVGRRSRSGRSTVRNNSVTFNGVYRRALLCSSGPLPGELGALLPPDSHHLPALWGRVPLILPFFADSVNFLVADVNRTAVHCQHQ